MTSDDRVARARLFLFRVDREDAVELFARFDQLAHGPIDRELLTSFRERPLFRFTHVCTSLGCQIVFAIVYASRAAAASGTGRLAC